jgi:hypothetical protein
VNAIEEKKMKRIMWFSTIVVVAMMAGCATVNIRSEHDPQADFMKYKTFNFPLNIDDFARNVIRANPFLHKEMLSVLEETMAAKGYVKTDNKPDLFVVYHVATEKKNSVSTYTGGYYGWGYRGWGVGYTNVRVDQYTEGTLVIDLVDADEEDLVWRGWASGTIEDRPNYDRLRDVVKGMLAEFPPKE